MITLDELIVKFDRGLRTLAAPASGQRPSPAANTPIPELPSTDRARSARMMRVNHAGEICAQALYQGQALTARDDRNRQALEAAGQEELDHLAWCEERLTELQGRTSLLNPLWYAGSFALGTLSGLAGDRWNLAFLVETERQVESHLKSHLERLPEADKRSRLILEQMQREEAGHAEMARQRGAATMPGPLRQVMARTARVMTGVTYWV